MAWLAAYYAPLRGRLVRLQGDVPPFFWCWRQLPLSALLAAVAYRLAGMYQIGRLRRFREEIVAVAKGTALLALFLLSALFFLHDPYESRGNVAPLRRRHRRLGSCRPPRRLGAAPHPASRGYNQTQALIVGTGRAARRLDRTLPSCVSWLGIVNVGFVEERRGPLSADLPVLGTFDDLPQLIATKSSRTSSSPCRSSATRTCAASSRSCRRPTSRCASCPTCRAWPACR